MGHIRIDIDSIAENAFHSAIAMIQEKLGQTTGDTASMYFSDGGDEEIIDKLKEYAQFEIDNLNSDELEGSTKDSNKSICITSDSKESYIVVFNELEISLLSGGAYNGYESDEVYKKLGVRNINAFKKAFKVVDEVETLIYSDGNGSDNSAELTANSYGHTLKALCGLDFENRCENGLIQPLIPSDKGENAFAMFLNENHGNYDYSIDTNLLNKLFITDIYEKTGFLPDDDFFSKHSIPNLRDELECEASQERLSDIKSMMER